MTDVPLTPAERRALIERPFSIQTIGGKGWGGTTTANQDDPTHQKQTTPNSEQSILYGTHTIDWDEV